MAIFNSPDLAMQKPEHWGQYVPKLEDYRTTDEYNAALQEYQAWLASTPGGQPAGVAPQDYTGPGGEQWHAAGSQRMADQSQGNYDANLLNSRLQNASTNPTGATARMLNQALQHRASIRPEETQGAYQAMNPDGSPVLAEPLLALYERLGIRPEAYAPGMNGKPIAMPPNGITPWTPPEGAQPPDAVTPSRGSNQGDLTLGPAGGPIRVTTPGGGIQQPPPDVRGKPPMQSPGIDPWTPPPGAQPPGAVGTPGWGGGGGNAGPPDTMWAIEPWLMPGGGGSPPSATPGLQQMGQPSPQMTTFEQWLKNKYGGGNSMMPQAQQGYGFQ